MRSFGRSLPYADELTCPEHDHHPVRAALVGMLPLAFLALIATTVLSIR